MLLLIFLIVVVSAIYITIFKKHNTDYIAGVAGKSGGHIIPCISLLEEYKNKKIIFFSTNSDLDKKIVLNSGSVSEYIPLKLDNFPRNKIWLYPAFIYNFIRALTISFYNLNKYRPEKIVTTGGYISMPVLISAYILQIPIEIFELNAVPGQATKIMSFLASKIYVCFDHAKKYFNKNKVEFKEYPLRYKNISSSVIHDKPVLLLIGGSQGSQYLNKLIQDFINYIKDNNLEFNGKIVHQTGSKEEADKLRDFYEKNNITSQVFDFVSDLAPCYQEATLVISRAGSGSLHELKYFNKKAIIIPLETKITDHQVDNAQEWASKYPDLYKLFLQKNIDQDPETFYKYLFKHFFCK